MEASLTLPLNVQQVFDLVKQLPKTEKQQLFAWLLKENVQKSDADLPLTHFASEKTLAKDWLDPKEDEAWQDL